MPETVRIGNAHGFWGDRLEAAAEMLSLEPELDFLTLDFLAEVSMSILAAQRHRDPTAGYARDFIEVVHSLVPYWRSGGRCRVVTNAGGLNPLDCGRACQQVLEQAGCADRSIAVVTGDDVLELLLRDAKVRSELQYAKNLDTGEPIDGVIDDVSTANAYLGAQPIADALSQGADLVITGRVADPSLTVGPCMHHFGWSTTDYDRIAAATIAGHMIECGTQVTGGISTDWLSVPDLDQIGFPIAEVDEDGICHVTKPVGSGGRVTESTVKEQLLYEIGDPDDYLSPDARVSLLSLEVRGESRDRVRVSGARGQPPTETYKVSATFGNGYRAAGQLTVFGSRALEKARRASQVVLGRLEQLGVTFQDTIVETLGVDGCDPLKNSSNKSRPVEAQLEVVLRIAVADPSRHAVVQFTRAMMPLITAGPPGTTGYAEGRPRVHPQIGYWPCLIRRDRVRADVQLLRCSALATRIREPVTASRPSASATRYQPDSSELASEEPSQNAPTGRLVDIAYARSGDKGRDANIGVIARRPTDFQRLRTELTCDRVASHLGVHVDHVVRYELPNLAAINFVIRGILENPLRVDAQGKALGQVMLQLRLDATQETGK